MFGYVTINKPELKIREYDAYHSYYCGLCHALGTCSGPCGRLTLSYDMTFLYLLLTGLYEPDEQEGRKFCPLHPITRPSRTDNEYASYAADMNILLSYYNLMDDWQDDHSLKSLAAARMLRRSLKKIKDRYPRQAAAVKTYITALGQMESHPEEASSLDGAAGLTGTMLGEIFCMKEDEWQESMRRIGFYLGKFIYLMDAWEDRDADRKSGTYNIWLLQDHEVTEDEAVSILNMMMGECSRCFEALPILKNAGILRNILYSGVWTKFEQIKIRRDK